MIIQNAKITIYPGETISDAFPAGVIIIDSTIVAAKRIQCRSPWLTRPADKPIKEVQ